MAILVLPIKAAALDILLVKLGDIMVSTDSALLQAARKLEPSAITEIFDLYARPIYCFVLRSCSDPLLADQMVGDVFSELLEQFAIGKGPVHNLRAYLYESAYHRMVDESRFWRRQAPLELTDLPLPGEYGPGVQVENRMDMERVQTALLRLSSYQRHVIFLRFLAGFNIKETAAILGKTTGSVKVAQCRALDALRNLVIANSAPSQSENISPTGMPSTR